MSTLVHHNFISTGVASKLSGYNPDYLSRLCRAGSLTAERVGRAWTIERASLEDFIERQKERKAELAMQISKQREEEYRQAARGRGEDMLVASTSNMLVVATPAAHLALDSESKRLTQKIIARAYSPFRVVTHVASVSVLRVPYLATGATALALAGGVLLAGSGLVERAGVSALEMAFVARESTIQNLTTLHLTAQQHRQNLLGQVVSAPEVFAHAAPATHRSLAALPDQVTNALHAATPEVSLSRDTYHAARRTVATYPNPVSARELYAAVVPFTDPAHVRATALIAYAQTGQFLYDQGEALGNRYLGFITASGKNLLVLGEHVRDEGRYVGETSARVATTFSENIATTHNNLVHGYVAVAQAVPPLIFSTLYTIGDQAGIYIAQGIQGAPEVAKDTARLAVSGLERMSEGLYGGGYALGQEIRQYDNRMTASALSFSKTDSSSRLDSPLTGTALWNSLWVEK